MKNKKILEVCLSPGLGGLEMFVASCYEAFSKHALCKVVVAPETKLDKYLEIEDKYHIKRSKFFPFLPAWRLAKYIDKNDIDIVHFHWTRDMITVILAKLFSKKKPKVVQSRHMGMTRFKDDLYHRYMYKNIDMIHAVTKRVKQELQKFIPDDVRPKIEMVYLGVEISKVDEKKVEALRIKYNFKDDFIVGIIGRIEEGKGQHLLVEALSKLDTDIKALIVGDVMDENYLAGIKEKVKKENLSERVVFSGFTKDVNEHMQLCDILVLATKNETFGLVIIEAMANKVAVIVTNNGGPLEIIDDKKDGVLFDGTSADLAKKIESLYNDRELANSIAEAGYEKVQKQFDKRKQLAELYNVLKKI